MARGLTWIDNTVDQVVVNNTVEQISMFEGNPPIDIRRSTITRIIIALSVFSTTVGGAWGVQKVSMGMGVVGQSAVLAGTNALPDPLLTSERPSRGWMWFKHMAVSQNVQGGQVVFEVPADLRSQRKVQDGELVLIIRNTNVQGTLFAVQLVGSVRVLLRLP